MGIREVLKSLFDSQPPARTASCRGASENTVEPRRESPRVSPRPVSKSEKYLSAEEATHYFVPDEQGRLPVRIRDGFFYHPRTRKSVKPGNVTLAKHGLRSFTVRGANYYAGDVKAADTRPGQPAILRREPDNKHDENAVAICGLDRAGTARRVGYVSKGRAKTLARRIDAGEAAPEAYFMRGAACGSEAHEGIAIVLCDRAEIDRLMR